MGIIEFISELGCLSQTNTSLNRRGFLTATTSLAGILVTNACTTESLPPSLPTTNNPLNKPIIDYQSLPPQLQTIYNDLETRGFIPALEAILTTYNGFDSISTKDALFDNNNYNLNSVQDQRDIKVATHLFWLEQSHLLPWSVKQYNKIEMVGLTDSDTSQYNISTPLGSNGAKTQYKYAKMRSETHKVFPITMDIINAANAKTPHDAINAVVEWAEKNFFHQYSEWSSPEADAYETATTWGIKIEDIFTDRGLDCHLASMVVATMLRSINIPADYILDTLTHGSVYFPTTQQFVHGDFIAMFAAMPGKDILQNEKDWTYWTQEKHQSYEKFREAQFKARNVFANPQIQRNKQGLYLVGGGVLDKTPTAEEMQQFNQRLPEYNITFQPNDGYLGSKGWGMLKGNAIVPIKLLE